ncbi:hypothetical protein [Nocardioides sp.]|uniref:hypothetical protein n=1 Tax=Nocardioides sp. TaxID=35761 RepID=UPI002D1D1817|nr:hypothetical protein [Nocardioides sp.]HSX66886.1 hypothetical protein [Nocardioides sp.]
MEQLKVVDWAQGGWFLLESPGGNVYLDTRTAYGAFDGTALLELEPHEIRRWRSEGNSVIHDLARQVYDHYYDPASDAGGHSVWWERDLRRSSHSRELRAAVMAAVREFRPWIEWKAKQ